MLENYPKPALSFNQQLEKLKTRGLIVEDDALAISQLSSISYYRLSAYWYPFRIRDNQGRVTDDFIAGTKFFDIIELYEFDRELRLLVIDALERVEVFLRTSVSYHLSRTYDAFGHTDSANFHPNFGHTQWIEKLNVEAGRSSDAFVAHYKRKYNGFPKLPIWMVTEVMSLGSLSFCFKGLKPADKRTISSQFGLHHVVLADWLHKLTYIRNVCAHHSRLWNRELSLKPVVPRDNVWGASTTPPNDRIFYVLLMLRYILKKSGNGSDWQQKCNDLLEPIVLHDKWRIAMGMPQNWQEHPLWK